jgi:sec-independent protein translocase protein TatA
LEFARDDECRDPGALDFRLLSQESTMFEGLFQPTHLMVILVLCVIIFGPKKLPELGKGLGEGIRSFRDSMKEEAKAPETKDNAK